MVGIDLVTWSRAFSLFLFAFHLGLGSFEILADIPNPDTFITGEASTITRRRKEFAIGRTSEQAGGSHGARESGYFLAGRDVPDFHLPGGLFVSITATSGRNQK